MKRPLLLTLLALLMPLMGMATMPRFVNIAMETEANMALSLTQDDSGLMWVGTNQGLYNFDGYHLHRNYTPHEAQNVRVNCMVNLGDTLCLGTSQGLLFFSRKNDSYLPVPIRFQQDIRSLLHVGKTLWIGTLKGLYQYDLQSHRVENIGRALPHPAVYALQKTSKGDIFIGTFNGLCRWDKRTKQIKTVNIPRPSTGNLFINSLLRDDDRNCMWVGTEGNLWRYDLATGQCTEPIVLNSCVKSLALLPDRRLAIGTDNGLVLWKEGTSAMQFQHDSRMPHSLVDDNVWSLLCDRDGNLWAGTNSDISVLPHQTDLQIIALADVSDCVSGNTIGCITRDRQGRLWLGGDKGLLCFPPSAERAIWYRKGNAQYPLAHNMVHSIYLDQQDDMWLATDGGPQYYNPATQRVSTQDLVSKDGKLSARWSHAIVEDAGGRMYVASYLGGILGIDKKVYLANGTDSKIAHQQFSAGAGLTSNNVLQMVIDHQGNKWAVQDNGTLMRIDTHQRAQKVNLDYAISHIMTVGNEVWCGADGTLFHLSAQGKVLATIHLPVYEYLLAMERVHDQFWVATVSGVWSVNPQTGDCHLLQLPDERYTCIYYDATHDQVYLGAKDKYVCVGVETATALRGNAHQLTFTTFRVNGEDYVVKDGCIRNVTEITLPSQESYVEVNFSDLAYAFDTPLRYECRLVDKGDEDDKDAEWTLVEGMSMWLDFQHSGHFVLEIRSVYQPDVVCRLPITVRSPWYATIWAYIIYTILLVLVIMGCVYLYRAHRRESILKQAQNRMDFLTNISHELKTPLSLIIGPISQMLSATKNADHKRKLEGVYHNAMRLNSLLQRALDTNRTNENVSKMLLFSHLELVHFCQIIIDGYRNSNPGKNFIFNSSVPELFMSTDIVKLEGIMTNLLTNACKYTGDDATIAISLTPQDKQVLIRVSDDGMGIAQKDRTLIFQRLYQSARARSMGQGYGLGLHLVKSYVEMLNGSIHMESTEGVGTVFSILLPLRTQDLSEETAAPTVPVEGDTRQKILVVEDNDALADFLVDTLSHDYQCMRASNGKAGLAISASVVPDLIIADVMMPEMNGLEMVKLMKENRLLSTVPIILLTAKDDSATEQLSIHLGVDCFMPKPFETPTLLARVQQLLKAKEALRSSVIVENLTHVDVDAVESSDEKVLARLTQLIEENITQADLNVAFVSDQLSIPQKTLYRLVKKYMNMSVVEYIRHIRIKKSALLLSQGKFTISEVMYMVGFTSASYFAKCFQQEFDCTPTQFVKKEN